MQSPSHEQIRAARERAGWTKEKAADTVMVSPRSWQAYEQGSRRMPPAIWALFCLAAGTMKMEFETEAGHAVVRRVIEAPKSKAPA